MIAALFVLATACGRSGRKSTSSGTVSGSSHASSTGIDFALEDLSGRTARLTDFKGKPVMVVFFATWCPPCRMEIPHLKKIHEKEIVDILAIDIQEGKSKVGKFVENQGIPYRVLLDESGTVSGRYSVNSIPTTLLINPDGSIHKKIVGFDRNLENVVADWVKSVRS